MIPCSTSMVINYRHIERIAIGPTKRDAPLIVYANREVAFHTALERLQAIARRNAQVGQLRGVVYVENLTSSCTTNLRWKATDFFRLSVEVKVFRKLVSEAFNHLDMLSEHDNIFHIKTPGKSSFKF